MFPYCASCIVFICLVLLAESDTKHSDKNILVSNIEGIAEGYNAGDIQNGTNIGRTGTKKISFPNFQFSIPKRAKPKPRVVKKPSSPRSNVKRKPFPKLNIPKRPSPLKPTKRPHFKIRTPPKRRSTPTRRPIPKLKLKPRSTPKKKKPKRKPTPKKRPTRKPAPKKKPRRKPAPKKKPTRKPAPRHKLSPKKLINAFQKRAPKKPSRRPSPSKKTTALPKKKIPRPQQLFNNFPIPKKIVPRFSVPKNVVPRAQDIKSKIQGALNKNIPRNKPAGTKVTPRKSIGGITIPIMAIPNILPTPPKKPQPTKKNEQNTNKAKTPSKRTPAPRKQFSTQPRFATTTPKSNKEKDERQSGIEKRSKNSPVKKVCKEYIGECGKQCRGTLGMMFERCKYKTKVPKFCSRKVSRDSVCPNDSHPKCRVRLNQMSICFKRLKVTNNCPGYEKNCEFKDIAYGPCINDGTKEKCDRYKRTPCVYEMKNVSVPCSASQKQCNECIGDVVIKTCTKRAVEFEEIACLSTATANKNSNVKNQSTDAKSTETSIIAALAGLNQDERNKHVRCFASFFDEKECGGVKEVCDIMDDRFDEDVCTTHICQICKSNSISDINMKKYCKTLDRTGCRISRQAEEVELYDAALFNTKVVKVASKCYVKKTTTKQFRCDTSLPATEVCSNGCRVKGCTKKIRDTRAVCRDNLSEECKRLDRNGCARKTRKEEVCSETKMCEFDVAKPVLCLKSRDEVVTCGGKCKKEMAESYVCGSVEDSMWGKCSQITEPVCTAKRCIKTVCKTKKG